MLGFLDTFDAVAFPAMILFGVCLFVEKNALLDEDDEGVAALVVLAHPPVRKVVAVDACCAAAENMVDDDVTMKKGRQELKTRTICLG